MTSQLSSAAVELALMDVICNIDYDTHKYIEMPEDGDESGYPALAEQFIRQYNKWLRTHEVVASRE